MSNNKKKHKQKVGELKKVDGHITQTTKLVKVTPGNITFPDKPPKINYPFPHPQMFKKKMMDEQFSKFLNIFKKL